MNRRRRLMGSTSALVATLAGAMVSPLFGCAELTPAQRLEDADTAASLAYAATATAANAAGTPDAAALKAEAWAVLQQERAAYAQGQDVTAWVTRLQGLATQAQALKGN